MEGDGMNKKLSMIKFIFKLMLLGMAVLFFIVPEDKSSDTLWLSQTHEQHGVNGIDEGTQYAHGRNAIAGVCAGLLMGCLFWFIYRKFQSDSRADLIAMENSLYKISLATGRTEYDLFSKSAENWSISDDRIEKDFKRYMANQDMPHYAKDFLRKNKGHIDDSLVKKTEVEPTSWSDWAKALLVFPGSVLLLVSLALFLG
jgi:hypothetical protein